MFYLWLVNKAQVNQIAVVVFTRHEFVILDLETLQLTDDLAQGSQEGFVADTALFGQTLDDILVGALEGDHAGDVILLHWFPP